MALKNFNPFVSQWFEDQLGSPTEIQEKAWPLIKAGKHTLISAPTGSGKTLAAFLGVIDDLVKESLKGSLQDQIHVVYVSPLKALSNDIHKNLQLPLSGIQNLMEDAEEQKTEVRVAPKNRRHHSQPSAVP